jgi:alpha-N-arabinofuranosidase
VHGLVPYLEAVATHDAEIGSTTLLCVNRSVDAPLELRADVRGLGATRLLDATTLCDPDLSATNSEDAPESVTPHRLDEVTAGDGSLRAVLPPVSWSVIRLTSTSPSTSHTDAQHMKE